MLAGALKQRESYGPVKNQRHGQQQPQPELTIPHDGGNEDQYIKNAGDERRAIGSVRDIERGNVYRKIPKCESRHDTR